jgi:hypothetical protein
MIVGITIQNYKMNFITIMQHRACMHLYRLQLKQNHSEQLLLKMMLSN